VLARNRRAAPAAAALALGALASCNAASSDVNVPVSPYVITIRNYMWFPADLPAPPGATVLVRNEDDVDHWLQSAAAQGQYVHAAVGGFDLDLRVPRQSERSFAIPARVAVGTVVPYFCFLFTSAMLDQGTITISAPGG
jgi:hypothetical protein